MAYTVTQQVVGRAFVCLLSQLASWPSQPADIPPAEAKLATPGTFSEKSHPITCWVTLYTHWELKHLAENSLRPSSQLGDLSWSCRVDQVWSKCLVKPDVSVWANVSPSAMPPDSLPWRIGSARGKAWWSPPRSQLSYSQFGIARRLPACNLKHKCWLQSCSMQIVKGTVIYLEAIIWRKVLISIPFCLIFIVIDFPV